MTYSSHTTISTQAHHHVQLNVLTKRVTSTLSARFHFSDSLIEKVNVCSHNSSAAMVSLDCSVHISISSSLVFFSKVTYSSSPINAIGASAYISSKYTGPAHDKANVCNHNKQLANPHNIIIFFIEFIYI